MKYSAYIAFDWADKKHDGCISVKGKQTRFQLRHSPETIEQWANTLRKHFPNGKVAITLELKSGPLFAALLKYDFFELYPLNPSTLSDYRKAFAPSGAKDDPTDAECMLDILECHPEKLAIWKPEDDKTRALRRFNLRAQIPTCSKSHTSLQSTHPHKAATHSFTPPLLLA